MATSITRQSLCRVCGQTVTSTPHPNSYSRLICPNCGCDLDCDLQNPNPNGNSAHFMAPLSNQDDLLPEQFPDFALDREIDYLLSELNDELDEFLHIPMSMLDEYFLPGVGEGEFSDQLLGNGKGTAESVVESIPSVTITAEIVGVGLNECVVCIESFCVGDVAKELPCKHMYHCECILRWLQKNNSCPLCRFKLPRDDVEFVDGMANSGGGMQENVDSSSGVRESEEL